MNARRLFYEACGWWVLFMVFVYLPIQAIVYLVQDIYRVWKWLFS